MAQQPIEGPATFERWKREKEEQHRALLLWVMMSDRQKSTGRANKQRIKGRSLDVIAKVMKRTQQTVSYWLKTRQWVKRLESYSSEEEARRDSYVLYRALYFKSYGRIDLPKIEQYLEHRLVDMDWTKPEALKELDRVMGRIIEAPTPTEKRAASDAAKDVAAGVDDAGARRRKEVKAYREIVSGTVEHYKKQLDAGKVKVSVSDLQTLLKIGAELEDMEYRMTAPEVTQTVGEAVEDGARVKHAKTKHPRGTDHQNKVRDRAILRAHLETCEEAMMFLSTQDRLLQELDESRNVLEGNVTLTPG